MTDNKKFTLAQLKPSVQDMPVTHPVHGDLDLTIRVQGNFAPSVKQKAIEVMAIIHNAQNEKKAAELARILNSASDASCEIAGAAIVGWSDDEAMGGAYTPAYAVELMKDPGMAWLKDQVIEYVNKEKNFFRKVGD